MNPEKSNINCQPASDEPEVLSVSADSLIATERAERYKRQLERPEVFPTAENWEYIIDTAMYQIAPELYRKYLMAWLTPAVNRSDFHDLALENFPEYLRAIPRADAVSAVYADVTSAPEATLAVILDCRLFDAPALQKILDHGGSAGFVAECMNAYQEHYTRDDLRDMQLLYNEMMQLPAEGIMRETRSIFGRDLRYICPNGHSNPKDTDFCTQCGLNINGLNADQQAAIDRFGSRLQTLDRLLRRLNL